MPRYAHPSNPRKLVIVTDEQMKFQTDVHREVSNLVSLLLEKNLKYGNSALNPQRVFSKVDPTEQIAVRIDDKLSRIKTTGIAGADEDTLLDLMGYLVLYRIAHGRKTNPNKMPEMPTAGVRVSNEKERTDFVGEAENKLRNS